LGLGAALAYATNGLVESKVFVKVTKEAILAAPEYHAPPLGATSHDAGNFDQ
jgi:hypothetical protein